MSENRLNAYHIMWIFVFFDLPVETKAERREATLFRKNLLKDGFTMLQFSVYIRHCASYQNKEVHVHRVKTMIPDAGNVSILCVTDKQFSEIINFSGKERHKVMETAIQLELF